MSASLIAAYKSDFPVIHFLVILGSPKIENEFFDNIKQEIKEYLEYENPSTYDELNTVNKHSTF